MNDGPEFLTIADMRNIPNRDFELATCIVHVIIPIHIMLMYARSYTKHCNLPACRISYGWLSF